MPISYPCIEIDGATGSVLQDLREELLRPLRARLAEEVVLGRSPRRSCRASMKITRWLTLRAKPISCVTTIIVMPSLASSTITSSTSPTISGSSAEVGSSNSMHDRVHRQRARDGHALLLAAGELAGELVLVHRSGRRGRASSGRASSRRPATRPSTLICASVRFSVTVRCGNSSKCWNTMPTRARSFGRLVFGSAIEMPSTTMSPFWNGSSALTHLDQRRLARARRAADDDDLALLDAGRAVGQHLEAAVPLGNVLDVDHGALFGPSDQRMMAIFFCSWRTSIDRLKQMTK